MRLIVGSIYTVYLYWAYFLQMLLSHGFGKKRLLHVGLYLMYNGFVDVFDIFKQKSELRTGSSEYGNKRQNALAHRPTYMFQSTACETLSDYLNEVNSIFDVSAAIQV